MTCAISNILIRKGETFTRIIRWEAQPLVSKAITAITKAYPAVVTSAAHGIPDGWRAAILSAGGMEEINAEVEVLGELPKASEFYKINKLTDDTISLPEVNSTEFTTYTSGGYLVYLSPVDLDGMTARLQIRASKNATGDPLLELTSADSEIVLDNTEKTITITIAASVTEDLSFVKGYYDLEILSGDVVTRLLEGPVVVDGEVTR